MSTTHPRRSGAQVLIDQLRIHGADTIFGVPGESYLAALDARIVGKNLVKQLDLRRRWLAHLHGRLPGVFELGLPAVRAVG